MITNRFPVLTYLERNHAIAPMAPSSPRRLTAIPVRPITRPQPSPPNIIHTLSRSKSHWEIVTARTKIAPACA